MAKEFSFDIEGLAELKGKISKLATDLQEEVGFEIQASAETIANKAKQDAPKNVGFLANEISSLKLTPLSADVISGAAYSAYVEFGTRGKVQIPAGLEEFAGQMQGVHGGSSLSAKEAIYQWCKQKGIPEEAWYPIFISVMTKGINPQPFFFKNFLLEKPLLIARIKKIVTDL